ncbi:hypothetical protein KAR28_06765 [Candidatus Parcubacteria bacterium]|nr:hypothetical protein [Candidatus Parcubacteria bacterium]
MKFSKKLTAFFVIISFFITSSCANNKELRRNTLIVLGIAAGVAIAGATMQNSGSSSNSGEISGDDGTDGTAGAGGLGLLFLLGGMLGGLFGLGVDLALEPIGKQKPNVESSKSSTEE